MLSGEEQLNREGSFFFSALRSIKVRGDHDGCLREERELFAVPSSMEGIQWKR